MATAEDHDESLCSMLEMGSESIYDFMCDLCIKDDRYLEAVGYCTNCQDYLCQECFYTHLRPKPLRHHILLDTQKMPKVISQTQSNDMCTETCTTHKDKMLEYYCAEHKNFGCSVCVILNHRNCDDIDYIPDMAAHVLTSQEYKDMNLKMKSLTKSTKQAISTAKYKTKTANKQHSDAAGLFKQLRKHFDKLEKLMMKEAETVRDRNKKKMKLVENQGEQLLQDIGALGAKFSSLETKDQHCKIFSSMKKSQDEIASFESSLQQLHEQCHITEYVIQINDVLHTLIQQPEKIASLEIINNPQDLSTQEDSAVSLAQPKPPQTTVTGHAQDLVKQPEARLPMRKWSRKGHKKSAAVHVMDIGVRMEEDTIDSYITGSVVLPGNKLVLVDSYHNDVQLIDMQSNQTVTYLRYESALWDITAVTHTQVAVTNHGYNTILFINVTDTLTIDHKVKLKDTCYGIACVGENFVITYEKPVKLEIVSQKGELLQTVVTEDRGKELFTHSRHVAVSPDKQTIYIADMARNTVTSLSLHGQIKAIYKDGDLNEPQGLTVDSKGIVYVCGYSSNNIHCLTPDLNKIQILLQESDGICQPKSVSYSEKQNRLYLGMLKSFEVYQLQYNSQGILQHAPILLKNLRKLLA